MLHAAVICPYAFVPLQVWPSWLLPYWDGDVTCLEGTPYMAAQPVTAITAVDGSWLVSRPVTYTFIAVSMGL